MILGYVEKRKRYLNQVKQLINCVKNDISGLMMFANANVVVASIVYVMSYRRCFIWLLQYFSLYS